MPFDESQFLNLQNGVRITCEALCVFDVMNNVLHIYTMPIDA